MHGFEEKKDEEQDTRPGYNVDWVVDLEKAKSDELICGFCKGVVRNHREVQCECEALYCYGCLLKNKVCVGCSKPIKDLDSLLFSKRTERKIRAMKAKCAFSSAEGEGGVCSWTGTLAQSDEHFETCEHAVIDCPFKCGAKVQRRHLAKHNKENLDVHQSCSLKSIMEDVEQLDRKVKVLWDHHESQFKRKYKAQRKRAIKALRCDWWDSQGANKGRKQMANTNIYLFVSKQNMFNHNMPLSNPPGFKIASKRDVTREMQKHGFNPAQNQNRNGYWWYNQNGFVNSQYKGQNKSYWLFKEYDQGYVNTATYFPYVYQQGNVANSGSWAGFICLKLKGNAAKKQDEKRKLVAKKYKITEKELNTEDSESEDEFSEDSDY